MDALSAPTAARPALGSRSSAPVAPTHRLRLVLLGRMEAWSPGSLQVLPRSRKARAILAILGLSPGTDIRRARLASLLWSQRGEEQQRGSLRQALHELQEALHPPGAAEPPILISSRDSVTLVAEQVWVDAVEIKRLGNSRPELLDLMRGDLLEDLDALDPAFNAWLADQRRELRVAATGHATALLAAADAPATRAAAAQRLLAIEPGAEQAWQALIRAEADRGDRAAALAAYDACRASLADRFRAAPSPETEALADVLRAAGAIAAPAPAVAAPARSTRGARLGVVPLRVLGAGVAEHLSSGLAEEITSALARFRWLCVVDSVSLAAAAARGGEAAAAAEHGLDFVLSGTVQPGAGRVRITLRLMTQGLEQAVVWTQRFDRDAGDLLAMQDEIAAEVVARVDPEILLIEADRAAARGSLDASAHDLLLRAIPAIHRLDRGGFLAAGDWLRRAIAAEPDYAPAHAWAAYWHLFLVGQGWAGDSAEVLAEAERLASRAIALDPLDAQALTILGHVRAFLHHRVDEGASLHQRALTLNPNLAMAWVFSGMALSYLGAHEAALARLDRYKQLAPCHPHAFFFDAGRGIPLLCLGRHAEAAAVGRDAAALQPGFSYPYKTYLAALGHLGLPAEVAAVRDRLLAIEPDFDVAKALRRTPLRRAEDRAHYEAGLRKAGLV